jgi:hypothetical protein
MRIILAPIELNIHQTILFNDYVCMQIFCRTYCINEYYWFNVYLLKLVREVVYHSDWHSCFLYLKLVAFLQVYIFTMLSALYFVLVVQEHHNDLRASKSKVVAT